ncbi:expressed unknown protein [Seminavis robusta]|uniref:CRAL-TRIO domain-containing protein n=1 Tax=Seminavis robusta TaxID=568900 RepID=A0A9N8HNV2_9STRA|nr:expressed unknown protein [Seminavis robusta]|eukprot:Sro1120_g243310.1 n/a (281) ;mRNA; f:13161-14003
MAPSISELSRKDTQPESFSTSDDDDYLSRDVPIVYTEEELDVMRQVRSKLVEEYGIEESRVGLTFLAVATINSKCRVEEAANKIRKTLELMEPLGCPDGISEDVWKPEAASQLAGFAPCGKDHNGAATIWIVGQRVPKEEERNHVHACIMHFLAVHADAISLRQGISLVVDVSAAPKEAKRGNESALQALHQSFPQRPQAIYIAGTNAIARVVVNATIKVASLFTKQKVLDRIQFVSVEQAKEKLPLSSCPKYVGGMAGGIESMEQWVEQRLQNLPKPEL